VFIVTIGLFQFLNWLDRAIWGGQQLPNTGVGSKQVSYPSLFPSRRHRLRHHLRCRDHHQVAGHDRPGAGALGVLFFVFNRTKLGLAMRAVASTPTAPSW
jgi:branched-subunit amino acid ABC-type transport system permease component